MSEAIRAVVIGIVVALAGTYPWAWLANANMRHVPSVPWGPLVMAAYLWLYWWYATGHGWPASTSRTRRENGRVRAIDESLWGAALVAGLLGLWFSVSLLRLIGRFVDVGNGDVGDLSRMTPITIVCFALTGALVAGVVEEIAFRGYMQRPLERRYGPIAAIAVVGVVFGLAHGTHTYWSLALMPYYVSVAAVYGVLAYLTDSILPSLVLHVGGDALDALFAVAGSGGHAGSDTGALQTTTASPRAGIWLNIFVLVATGAAAIWASWALGQLVTEPPSFKRVS